MIWADTRPGHPTAACSRARPTEHDAGQVVARTVVHHRAPAALEGEGLGLPGDEGRLGRSACWSAALLVLTGDMRDERGFVGLAAPVLALAFAARHRRAARSPTSASPAASTLIFLRPQWRSWLVRGAFILAAYGAVAVLWLLGGLLDQDRVVQVVALPAAVLAAGTAGYTAFLFGQCEGRDLWQTPLLLPVLLAQAVAAGAATLLVLAPLFDLATTS